MMQRFDLDRRRPVASTLARMARLVREHRADQLVRSTALSIVRGLPPGADPARMARVVSWVKAVMPFERDPRGVEAINSPLLSLEKIHAYGYAAGDCDDAATLIATLLESVGIRTRFKAVSIRADRKIHHVAVEAFDRYAPLARAWRYLDPFAPQEVGPNPRFTAALEVFV